MTRHHFHLLIGALILILSAKETVANSCDFELDQKLKAMDFGSLADPSNGNYGMNKSQALLKEILPQVKKIEKLKDEKLYSAAETAEAQRAEPIKSRLALLRSLANQLSQLKERDRALTAMGEVSAGVPDVRKLKNELLSNEKIGKEKDLILSRVRIISQKYEKLLTEVQKETAMKGFTIDIFDDFKLKSKTRKELELRQNPEAACVVNFPVNREMPSSRIVLLSPTEKARREMDKKSQDLQMKMNALAQKSKTLGKISSTSQLVQGKPGPPDADAIEYDRISAQRKELLSRYDKKICVQLGYDGTIENYFDVAEKDLFAEHPFETESTSDKDHFHTACALRPDFKPGPRAESKPTGPKR